MSEENWIESLYTIREELYGKKTFWIDETTYQKNQVNSEKEDLIKNMCCELKTVEKVFQYTGVPEEVPKIKINSKKVTMDFPIINKATKYASRIEFSLEVQDKIYGVNVEWVGTKDFISPPVENEKIRQKILKYLDDRKQKKLKIKKWH